MADYISHMRSNNFYTTDETKLEEIIECFPKLKLNKNDNGSYTIYGDDTAGITDDEGQFKSYEDLYAAAEDLQKIMPDNEALILQEIGHEKYRYLTSCAMIITKTDTEYLNLQTWALKKARELLKDADYITEMEY